MPHVCWTNYFLDCQGYKIDSTIMYQDNQSAILLENNGKKSSSKRTRHINIKNILLLIGSRMASLKLNIVRPMTWSQTTSPSRFKENKFLQFRKTIMNLKS